MDLFKEVKDIIHHVWLDGPTAPEGVTVRPETRFIEDLMIDSLASVELVICAEGRLGVQIDDGEYEDVRTVQDAVDFLQKKLGR